MTTINNTNDRNYYRISKARKSQTALLSNGNYCSIHSDIADELGCEPGQQLRLHPVGKPDRAAAYTVYEVHAGNAEVRMAKPGRERIDTTGPFEAVIDTTVPRTDLTYSEAWETNDIWETVWDGGQDQLVVCAPHGCIESNTAQAAAIVRKRLGPDRASGWFVRAWGEDAFDRWHITTTEMSPASYPGLDYVADRGFSHAVSFHVYNGDEIEIGGLANSEYRTRLAAQMQDAIDGRCEVIIDPDKGKYMATTEDNLTNWLTEDNESGVQIEMPPTIARNYRKRVARAVADFYDSILPEPE